MLTFKEKNSRRGRKASTAIFTPQLPSRSVPHFGGCYDNRESKSEIKKLRGFY